jgi:DNA-binding NtrC family response regulator/pSer/pThr/pTyr-binding forkhead associated (FHA) protein
MLRFEIRQHGKKPYQFESVKSTVFVGRDQSMDLVLDDPRVSRQHAVITSKDGNYFIQDVGGRNPVRVNRKVVVRHLLREGDAVLLGDTHLKFQGVGDGPAGADLGGAGEATEDASAVVDARETFQNLRGTPDILSSERTVSGTVDDEDEDAVSVGGSARNLRILRNFSELIRNISDRQRLLESALHAALDNLDVKYGFIGLFGPGGELEIRVQRSPRDPAGPISYSSSIVERAQQEGIAILFDAEGDSGPSRAGLDSRSLKQLQISSAMCLPLFKAEEVYGVLYIDDRGRETPFTEEDLYFANILSNLICLAVEKEELYEQIRDENIELKTILHQKNRFISVSPQMKEVQRRVKRVAGFDTTVLLSGESGTGKGLLARAVHDRSMRRARPFVEVNCSATEDGLLELELFGCEAGHDIAGADSRGKAGKLEQADGGTLFLDDVDGMSLDAQAKILSALEKEAVDRLGSTAGRSVNLRILAASNRPLSTSVEAKSFREDLYYRLKVFQIELAPLRERREDILPLARHFLSVLQYEDRGPVDLSPRTKELLMAYHWPGNIRELKHFIEEAFLVSNGTIIYPENLPDDLRREDNPQPSGTLSEIEAQHIRKVLQSVNWNKRRASEVLGINRSTLYEKIRLYHIERQEDLPSGEEDGTPG